MDLSRSLNTEINKYVVFITSSLLFLSYLSSKERRFQWPLFPHGVQSLTPLSSSPNSIKRRRNTVADKYFQKYQQIPCPQASHVNLQDLMQHDHRIAGDGTTRIGSLPNLNLASTTSVSSSSSSQPSQRKKVLVIGDVHGCLNELQSLVAKAITECNHGSFFTAIVLVGDMVNKGPQSAEVVRYVRTQKYWYSVRGNHDNGALAAALGDTRRRNRQKYEWVLQGERERECQDDDGSGSDGIVFSDEDAEWIADLPYTIRVQRELLPSSTEKEPDDILIVHAGLIPNVALEEQEVDSMITVREIIESKSGDKEDQPRYEFFKKSKFIDADSSDDKAPEPWATVWNGPETIIFGHDARRGLQIQSKAVGLDTGCCYGKELTGVLLPNTSSQWPNDSLVSVKAEKVHCPVEESK